MFFAVVIALCLSAPVPLGWPDDALDAVGFSEGLGAVQVNGLWGFIDATGRIAIEPAFEVVHPFSEGLAATRRDDRWGFIDRSGGWVIRPGYDVAYRGFRDGLAAVGIEGDDRVRRWGLIDRSGRFILQPSQESPPIVSEGLVAVREDKGERWGFQDLHQNWVVLPEYEAVHHFQEGLCAARRDGRWGFIDRTGGYVIEPSYLKVSGFSEGMAVVVQSPHGVPAQENGIGVAWFYIGRDGHPAISGTFADARPFSGGFAAVQSLEGQWRLIDARGRTIGGEYQWLTSPRHGYAVVEIDAMHWTYLSLGLRETLPLRLNWCGDFNEGIAPARDSSERYGYIDTSGRWVWPPSGKPANLLFRDGWNGPL